VNFTAEIEDQHVLQACIPSLLRIVNGNVFSNLETKEMSIRALGNIASFSDDARLALFGHDAR
jgi:hypothetical protein